jgi:hypothetical protein
VIVADDAYSIPSSAVATSASSGRSSVAAAHDGTATTTPSASIADPSRRTRQPAAVGSSARTADPVCSVPGGNRATSASTSPPMPSRWLAKRP